MDRTRPLREGYRIFYAAANEEGGPEKLASLLEDQINEAMKEYDIEFLSNAKIDADSGGHGRSIYFAFQCATLKKKKIR